jgi:HSP20 family molecular chaperone IbpA
MGALVQNGQAGRLAQRSPLQGVFGFDPFQAIVANWDYGFEVTRTENGYVVEVPVPGFNSSNVEITLKDGIVSVNAKNDRRTFSRSFTVPEDVDSDKIAASVTDGMLSITLERHPAAQPKRIVVK